MIYVAEYEYTDLQEWLDKARSFRAQAYRVEMRDDPLTTRLGFVANHCWHYIGLKAVKGAPPELRMQVADLDARKKLLES